MSQIPHITLNGVSTPDSSLIIERLTKELNLEDLDSWMSPESKAISRAFQSMMETDLYFCILWQRWVMILT
jgi:hypothetical protein